MATTRLSNEDFNQLQALNLRIHVSASAPSSPVTGQIYYDSGTSRMRYWNGGAWVDLLSSWVSSVTGSAPIVSSGGATPAISITPASASDPGSMSAAHYSLVNGATAANTASAVVRRGASGEFTAGVITTTQVTGLSAPAIGSDAANKAYVDNAVLGIDYKESVRVASTANVNTASPGTTIDGVTLANGERVLLKDQTTASQNGIYVFNGSGTAMTRAPDADSSAEVTAGMATFVSEGTANGNTQWRLLTDDPITLGTTALTFAQIGGSTSYTADGTSIQLTGTVFSIHPFYAGQNSINTVGTITAGTWTGTVIGLGYGGLGVDATTTAGKKTARDNINAPGIYTATIGDGSSTSISITQATHGLAASNKIQAALYDASTGARCECDVTVNNANGTVTFGFAVAPALNAYRIVLQG